jgi:hypothetical protein
MRYRIVDLKDIVPTDPIYARSGPLHRWHIEDMQEGYYALSFKTLEEAKERCEEWNDDHAADELSDGNI